MLLALALATTLSVSGDLVHLTPGTQEVLKFPGLRRVALVNEDVASVRVTNAGSGELLLLGKQSGRTSMTLWIGEKVVYKTIVVDSGRAEGLARLVHDEVSPTLQVAEYNGRIVIDGTLDSVEEMDRLRVLVGGDPNVKLLVHLGAHVLPFVATQITQALEREGMRQAHAVAIGNKIFLEGSVSDQAELQRAQQIADAIYSQSQVGLTTAQ